MRAKLYRDKNGPSGLMMMDDLDIMIVLTTLILPVFDSIKKAGGDPGPSISDTSNAPQRHNNLKYVRLKLTCLYCF